MREYLTAVVLIHKSATGEWIGRYNSIVEDGSSEGDHVKEKPHPYVVACLAAVHKRYTPKLLQEVLHKLKPSEVFTFDDEHDDWLHPNAKEFLAQEAREARLKAKSADSDTQGLHRNKATQ